MEESLDAKNYILHRRLQKIQEVIDQRTRQIVVVLEDIYQPHNASAVLRTCEVLGIQDVYIIQHRNLFQASSQITMGAEKWLDLHRFFEPNKENTWKCVQFLRNKGYQIIATTLDKEKKITPSLEIEKKLLAGTKMAFFFGNEEKGLSQKALELADAYFKLAMYGFTESLNISVSVAVTLHKFVEKLHQAKDLGHWQLSQIEKEELLKKFCRTSLKK